MPTHHDKDSATVELVAKAIYEGRNGYGCVPWHRQSTAHKTPYLKDARAALAALATELGHDR